MPARTVKAIHYGLVHITLGAIPSAPRTHKKFTVNFVFSELIESVMYLHRATGDPYLLEIGEDMLRSIQHSARAPCGFATVLLQIRMEITPQPTKQ